jgi:uncharacterized damage-inducible protein DinB
MPVMKVSGSGRIGQQVAVEFAAGAAFGQFGIYLCGQFGGGGQVVRGDHDGDQAHDWQLAHRASQVFTADVGRDAGIFQHIAHQVRVDDVFRPVDDTHALSTIRIAVPPARLHTRKTAWGEISVPPGCGQSAYPRRFVLSRRPMDLHQHLRLMADYHAWALDRLYAEIDALADDDYFRDCGQFFGSVHGTLNHLLLVEHLWQARLRHDVFPTTGLDQQLEAERGALRRRLFAFAKGWRSFVDRQDGAAIAGDLTYRNLQGTAFTLPFASLVLHVFNHATHHRGQASIALIQMGRPAPVMDLPYFLNELPAQRLHAP